jgi:hypothetical protein
MSAGLALKSAQGRWVLAVAILGSGMAFLDGTIVKVALPAIGEDLDARRAPFSGFSTVTCSAWPR